MTCLYSGSRGITYVEVSRDGDDGVGNLLAQVGLGDLLHLAKNHGRHLLRGELLLGTGNLNGDDGLAILIKDLVGEVLGIVLDVLVVELTTDQAPCRKLLAPISWRERPA